MFVLTSGLGRVILIAKYNVLDLCSVSSSCFAVNVLLFASISFEFNPVFFCSPVIVSCVFLQGLLVHHRIDHLKYIKNCSDIEYSFKTNCKGE